MGATLILIYFHVDKHAAFVLHVLAWKRKSCHASAMETLNEDDLDWLTRVENRLLSMQTSDSNEQ